MSKKEEGKLTAVPDPDEERPKVKQLIFDGLRVDPQIQTTFRGSVKMTGVPKQKGGTKVKFEGYGTINEIRVKEHSGNWKLQQIISPDTVDLMDDKGETIGSTDYIEGEE